MFNPKLDLQLFSDGIDTVGGLDSLLGGNTPEPEPEPETDTTDDIQEPSGLDDGGDPDLDSSEDDEPKAQDDGDVQRQQQAANSAFARMRVENTQYAKTLQELAKALGIQEQDPRKLGDMLVNMAQEKLANDANVPVELYQELHQTKEQLAAVQYQQNQIAAREKFMAVKETYGLDDKELVAFAKQLDEDDINAVMNPNVDLEYEYYKRNREAIEKKRIAQAVEEALRKSNAAEQNSTTPPKQQGGNKEPVEKINNVSALEELLNNK